MLDSLTGYVGGQIPLGVGPAIPAIPAFLPDAEAAAVIEVSAGAYQNFKNLSVDKIRPESPIIRNGRFAIDNDQLVAGISGFAILILPQGRDAVGAIATGHDQCPTARRTSC
ncbi:hypothetical protein U8P76_23650 [Rhizobium johnstonii]|nr:hypothetical protein U8P76_23650 [Rhizobium johnstonii]